MNASDRHFALLEELKSEKNDNKKKRICIKDIGLVDKFNKECIREYGKLPKSYPSFKTLAILYEKEGDYKSAIKVCQEAIRAGYPQNGTQGGMEARIKKLHVKEGKK